MYLKTINFINSSVFLVYSSNFLMKVERKFFTSNFIHQNFLTSNKVSRKQTFHAEKKTKIKNLNQPKKRNNCLISCERLYDKEMIKIKNLIFCVKKNKICILCSFCLRVM